MSRTRLSDFIFNFYAEHIMRNAELDEAQAGIKIARKNINNLRYPGTQQWLLYHHTTQDMGLMV